MDFVLVESWCQYWVRGGVGWPFSRILYVFGQSVTFDVAVNILLQQVAAVPSKDST